MDTHETPKELQVELHISKVARQSYISVKYIIFPLSTIHAMAAQGKVMKIEVCGVSYK
jgi:hypothetical protein